MPNPGEKKFKFKAIKTYASTESFQGDQKNYRRVFENQETTYIYCELSFYNKLFDEEDWNAKINLKAYSVASDKKRTELCSLDIDKPIPKDENVVTVRNSWGMSQAGAFWKRGDYDWEGYIDGELVGTQRFHVEDGGLVNAEDNPYFQLKSVRMYEGPYDGVEKEQRKYYTQFAGQESRYIFAEISLENRQNAYWFCELFFNFYNDAGQLKGTTSNLVLIAPDQTDISMTSGWGSSTPGTWFNDKYKLEVVFMDTLMAVIPFNVAEDFVEGNPQVFAGDSFNELSPMTIASDEDETLEEVMKKLNEMIGLQDIKNKIADYTSYLKFLQLRNEQGFEEGGKISLHTVFTGNPGTGKTTVAHMLGKIYKKMGLLSRGDVTEVGRAELVGKYIGQTAPKVKEMIDKARGGVMFIDEAYALMRSENDEQDFGREVIEILIKEMSDGEGDLAILVAGYPDPMNRFLDSNPGLRSRFNLFFHFPDYLPQELLEIMDYKSQQKGVTFSEEARAFLYEKVIDAYRNRDKAFGNARMITSWVEEAKMNMGLRVIRSNPDLKALTADQMREISLDDAKALFKATKAQLPDIRVDENLLTESLNELNSLIGLSKVKAEINELVKLVKFYRESGKDVLGKFSLHTVFTGNPGTGKTTVARILAKIYKALGILERGHMTETDRQGMVAGFVGQTAIKTSQQIDKALGGVLFIDEAYALSQGGDNDFGREAIETLLKQMEDRRGQFVVVTAGYTDNMTHFLEMNPGLKSRFDRVIHFEDYNADELIQIARNMLRSESLTPDDAADTHLRSYLTYLHQKRDKFFGNARSVRKIIEKAITNQNLRMASLEKDQRTPDILQTLTFDDVDEFDLSGDGNTNAIGFKFGNASK
jgi:SpoVK/Ycf46/Vps4 family AAA+-type ATPase